VLYVPKVESGWIGLKFSLSVGSRKSLLNFRFLFGSVIVIVTGDQW
jgi:hypothetical protein